MPTNPTEADLPEEDPGQPENPQEEQNRGSVAGLLPQFRRSPRTTSRPATDPSPSLPLPPSLGEDLGEPSSAGATGKSSATSTDDDEELVDPADLQAAIRQVVDIAFVGVGQTFGALERRAKALAAVDPKWMPTKEERTFVLEPAGRIAKRHIKAPAAAMDTIDGCLIATGVAAFSMRAYLGVDALPKEGLE